MSDKVKLTPIVIKSGAGEVYAPSKLQKSIEVSNEDLETLQQTIIPISTAKDGYSNAEPTTTYFRSLGRYIKS